MVFCWIPGGIQASFTGPDYPKILFTNGWHFIDSLMTDNVTAQAKTKTRTLHVVAAVIYNDAGEILIAKRPTDKHQGGKWEFPGGKVEAGESSAAALQRELEEELGIRILQTEPLIQIQHDYPEKSVHLEVSKVAGFTGNPYGREGQSVKWVTQGALSSYTFPDANLSVLKAIALPDVCLITPDPSATENFFAKLEKMLNSGIRLMIFRAKSLSSEDYSTLADEVITLAHKKGAKVILNSPPISSPNLLTRADGLHLTSTQIGSASKAWPGRDEMQIAGKYLSVSCHTVEDLQLAEQLGADFAFLSPVKKTTSHPDAIAMGWEEFQHQLKQCNIPVFALGGLGREDLAMAKDKGAQGIAAISRLMGRVVDVI